MLQVKQEYTRNGGSSSSIKFKQPYTLRDLGLSRVGVEQGWRESAPLELLSDIQSNPLIADTTGSEYVVPYPQLRGFWYISGRRGTA